MAPYSGNGAQPVDPATENGLIEEVNRVRTGLGLTPLIKSAQLTQAASSHARYWITHRGDFHNEVRGLEHFSGVSIFDRAKAAGYELNWIDEVAGLLDPARTLDLGAGDRLPPLHVRAPVGGPHRLRVGHRRQRDGFDLQRRPAS